MLPKCRVFVWAKIKVLEKSANRQCFFTGKQFRPHTDDAIRKGLQFNIWRAFHGLRPLSSVQSAATTRHMVNRSQRPLTIWKTGTRVKSTASSQLELLSKITHGLHSHDRALFVELLKLPGLPSLEIIEDGFLKDAKRMVRSVVQVDAHLGEDGV